MKTIIIRIWEILTTNFWFLPLLIILSAIASSYGLIRLDRTVDVSDFPEFYRLYYTSGADGARAVLSTIASSMMTVAGIVFSITIVALTLASSQFGPRLLRNFMSDRINQVVLGIYVATFTYCLLVLRTVTNDEDLTFVPHISVLFAMILAIANILLLVIYIHHISTSIQADYIIYDVARALDKNIEKLFPDDGEQVDSDAVLQSKLASQQASYPVINNIFCTESGYLQAIDRENLLDLAQSVDLIIFLDLLPGDFAVKDQLLVKALSGKEELKDKQEKKIRSYFIFGQQRTPTQDPEFAINQLVEVAVRALSPGINDPYTAMACIDRLGATISKLTSKKFPPVLMADKKGEVRLIGKPILFSHMMDSAFNQIRLNGKSHAAVLIRMMEIFNLIARLAKAEDQQGAIVKHAEMVKRASDEFLSEPCDKGELEEKFTQVIRQSQSYSG